MIFSDSRTCIVYNVFICDLIIFSVLLFQHFKETGNSNASNPKGDLSSFNCSVGTMLDLKLAMYLPFCRKMTSGVFLTASDDIEIYAIGASALIDNTS